MTLEEESKNWQWVKVGVEPGVQEPPKMLPSEMPVGVAMRAGQWVLLRIDQRRALLFDTINTSSSIRIVQIKTFDRWKATPILPGGTKINLVTRAIGGI